MAFKLKDPGRVRIRICRLGLKFQYNGYVLLLKLCASTRVYGLFAYTWNRIISFGWKMFSENRKLNLFAVKMVEPLSKYWGFINCLFVALRQFGSVSGNKIWES